MAFHNIRLPEEIEQGAKGGPSFQTTIVTMTGGVEQRNVDWIMARQTWDIGYGIQSASDFVNARQFFYARRGSGYAFRFKDWSDYQLNLEQIGIGDGTTSQFQIIKSYESGGPLPLVRTITKPVDGTSLAYDTISGAVYTVPTTVKVYVDGVLKTLTTDYTVNGTTGIITFTAPPASTKSVNVTLDFDTPVRFDTDQFDLSLELFNAGIIQNLKIIEVFE